MVLHVPEIPPKVTEIVTLSEGGGGLGKTTLSLSKDVTIRWGGGSKSKETMSFYMMFFFILTTSLRYHCWTNGRIIEIY